MIFFLSLTSNIPSRSSGLSQFPIAAIVPHRHKAMASRPPTLRRALQSCTRSCSLTTRPALASTRPFSSSTPSSSPPPPPTASNQNATSSSNSTTHFGFETVPEAEKQHRVAEVFTSVAESYDRMNDLMSFGWHRVWKYVTFFSPRLYSKPNLLFL